MKIADRKIIGIVSQDDSGAQLLRSLAGVKEPGSGELWRCFSEYCGGVPPEKRGFVPDDIVCYSNLKTGSFFHGLAWAAVNSRETEQEAKRLMKLLGVPPEENLLNLTFEQGRLVVMIQAMMRKPELLLLENPHDMIGGDRYLVLVNEWIKLFREKTRYIITEHTYEDIVLPCECYLFLQDGRVVAEHTIADLPRPAKVITMTAGKFKEMDRNKAKVLFETDGKICFIYEETDMRRLSFCLRQADCQDYTVEDIRLEERIFENYERWKRE